MQNQDGVGWQNRGVQTERERSRQRDGEEKDDMMSTFFASKEHDETRMMIEVFDIHCNEMPKIGTQRPSKPQPGPSRPQPLPTPKAHSQTSIKAQSRFQPLTLTSKTSIKQSPKKKQQQIFSQHSPSKKKQPQTENNILCRIGSKVSLESLDRKQMEIQELISNMREENQKSYRVRENMIDRVVRMGKGSFFKKK